jgi:hypothetical protein
LQKVDDALHAFYVFVLLAEQLFQFWKKDKSNK